MVVGLVAGVGRGVGVLGVGNGGSGDVKCA